MSYEEILNPFISEDMPEEDGETNEEESEPKDEDTKEKDDEDEEEYDTGGDI